MFKWLPVHQEAFDKMKTIMAEDILLRHPNYNQGFELHTDASKDQIGGVISQNNAPIGFFSRKFNPAQLNYTVTEK